MARIKQEALKTGDTIKTYFGSSKKIARFEPAVFTPGCSQEARYAIFEDGSSQVLYRGKEYEKGFTER